MTHGSLFSGIGGFELAAEWSGFTNVFSCEIEPFNQRVLKHYWPNSELHTDVKEFPSSDYTGRIDILTGGFPCQPYSTAGKRLGKEDDRHLWPFMLEIIREIAPTYVVGENVRGLVNWSDGLVFEEVCADLEAAGYDVQPFVLPAAGLGAPHRRDRVWFIAHSNNSRARGTSGRHESSGEKEWIQERDEVQQPHQSGDIQRHAAHTDRCAARPSGKSRETESCWGKHYDEQEGRRESSKQHSRRGEFLRDTTNAERDGLEHSTERGSAKEGKGKARERVTGQPTAESKERDFTNTNNSRLQGRKNDRVIDASEPGRNEQLARRICSVWEKFPTQPPVCGGNDGLPRELDGITFSKWRNQSIKAYGNAIVPQVAYQIFQTIKQMHND